jgi:predicted phosphate transport protein (TIGR00153 family)
VKTVHAIAELFGRSPFGPLVRHTQKVHECVREVKPLIEAFLRGDYEEVERLYDRISDLEHEADDIKREIRTHLPKSLYLPVNRADMLKYLKEQDAIADTAEDIAVLLTIRRTDIPAALHDEILLLTDKVIETSDLLVKAASELERLQESVFGGGPDIGLLHHETLPAPGRDRQPRREHRGQPGHDAVQPVVRRRTC